MSHLSDDLTVLSHIDDHAWTFLLHILISLPIIMILFNTDRS
jgi:hypothetical protein